MSKSSIWLPSPTSRRDRKSFDGDILIPCKGLTLIDPSGLRPSDWPIDDAPTGAHGLFVSTLPCASPGYSRLPASRLCFMCRPDPSERRQGAGGRIGAVGHRRGTYPCPRPQPCPCMRQRNRCGRSWPLQTQKEETHPCVSRPVVRPSSFLQKWVESLDSLSASR